MRLPAGEQFRATVHEPTIATDFWAPNIDDVVSVLVKTENRKVKFDKDDDRLSLKSFEESNRQALQEAQDQPPGTLSADPTLTGGIPDAVAKKLAQLGIAPGTPLQVFTGGSAEGQAAMAAAFTHADTPSALTSEARLAQLEGMYARGLITADEHTKQRQRILDEL